MFNDVIQTIGAAVIIPLVTILGKYLVDFFKAVADDNIQQLNNKKAQEYAQKVSDIVTQAVTATSQNFVDSLKAEGNFTPEAQLHALERTKTFVLKLLTAETKAFIESTYGDLNTWVNTKIEQTLFEGKTVS